MPEVPELEVAVSAATMTGEAKTLAAKRRGARRRRGRLISVPLWFFLCGPISPRFFDDPMAEELKM
jgi:hypothetical protein